MGGLLGRLGSRLADPGPAIRSKSLKALQLTLQLAVLHKGFILFFPPHISSPSSESVQGWGRTLWTRKWRA